MRFRRFWSFGLWYALASMAVADAAENAQWEAGVGLAYFNAPDYRGSNERQNMVLPVPYLSYDSGRLRVDRGGVHRDLFQRDDLSLDLSLGIGPPTESDENEARRGMPDLMPTVEVGPSFRWRWWQERESDWSASARVSLRAIVATDLSDARYVGWVVAPQLTFDWRDLETSGWVATAAIGPMYAAEQYHDYYYEVRPAFVTPARPRYDARGGYSGSHLTFSLSRRYASYWVGGFVRIDDLRGAVFHDSSLVRSDYAITAGIAISQIFWRSAPPDVGFASAGQ